MTREEAIKVLRTESVEIGGNAVIVCRFWEALDMAIYALRQEKTVTERHQLNEPLTLDDLRKIYDGEEGAVWVKIGKSCWPAILDIYYGKLVAVWSALDFCHESNYGKTWLAYRQKPEEGTV